MLIPSEAFAVTFVSLLYNQPKSKVLYVIFFLLTMDLKLNILIDLNMIYQHDSNGELAAKYNETLIGQGNVISQLIGMSNILNFTRNAHPAISLLIVVLLLLLFAWITYELFKPKKIKAFSKNQGESERKVSLSVTFMSAVLSYFDYLFFFVFSMLTESVTCLDLETRKVVFQTNDYVTAAHLAKEEQTYQLVVRAPVLNKNISCSSVEHIVITGLIAVLCLLAVFLKLVSHKLLQAVPNPNFPLSKFSFGDLFHCLAVMCLFVTKAVLRGLYSQQIIANFSKFTKPAIIICCTDLLFHSVIKPYFSHVTNVLRMFESILYLVLVSLLDITLSVPAGNYPKLLFKQYPLFLVLTLCVIILQRCLMNLSSLFEMISFEVTRGSATSLLLKKVYKGLQFVDTALTGSEEELEATEFTGTLFDFLSMKRERTKNERKQRAKEVSELDQQQRDLLHSVSKPVSQRAKDLLEQGTNLDATLTLHKKMEGLSQEQTDMKGSNTLLEAAQTNAQSSPLNKKVPPPASPPGSSKAGEIDLSNSNGNITFDPNPRAPNQQQKPVFLISQESGMSSRLSADSALRGPKGLLGDKENDIHPSSSNQADANFQQFEDWKFENFDKAHWEGEYRPERSRSVSMTGNATKRSGTAHLKEIVAAAKSLNQTRELTQQETNASRKLKVRLNRKKALRRTRHFLLDSIVEARSSGIKFPIAMMNELLEEYLEAALENPNVDFSSIESLVVAHLHLRMVYLGDVYGAAVKARLFEYRFSREGKKNSRKFRATFAFIYAMIRRHVSNNLETGNLILPKERSRLTFTRNQASGLSLYSATTFINSYEHIKQRFSKICSYKSKMLETLLNEGADFKRVFSISGAYADTRTGLKADMEALVGKSGGQFTPLMMIYGNYLYHVEQDMLQARKVLKKFLEKQLYFDMQSVTDLELARHEEMATMGVSFEQKSFHKINMASCNVHSYLEYDSIELVGLDLNALLPSPLDQYHADLMRPANITGALFEQKTMGQVTFKKKNGFITTCKSIFRMNYRVSSCLEVFAALIFDKETFGQKNLMVVDEEMKITEISEVGTDVFEKGTYIFQYNSQFRQVFSDLNYVSNFRLKFDKIDLPALMSDSKIMAFLKTHFDFLSGEEVRVLDKAGRLRDLVMKISAVYTPSVRRFIRFVEYDLAAEPEEGMAGSEDWSQEQEEPGRQLLAGEKKKRQFNFGLLEGEELKLKRLLDDLEQSTIMKQAQAERGSLLLREEKERRNDKELASPGLAEKPPTPGLQASQKPGLDVARPPGASAAPPENPHIENIKRKVRRFIRRLRRKVRERRRLPAEAAQSLSRELRDHDEAEAKKEKARTRKPEEGPSNGASSSIKKYSRKDNRDQLYVDIVRAKLSSVGSNVMFVLLGLLLLGSAVLQAVVGFTKYQSTDALNREIDQRIAAVDFGVKAVYYAVSALTVMELHRSLDQSLIPNSLLSEFGVPSLRDLLEAKKKPLKSGLMASFTKLEVKMRNATYTDLFDLQAKINSREATGFVLENQPFAAPADPAPQQLVRVVWRLRKLLFYLQPYLDKLADRPEGLQLDSQQATFDDILRKSLGGDVSGILEDLSVAVAEYFQKACTRDRQQMLSIQLLSIGCLAASAGLIALYALALQAKMRQLYSTVFDVKVGPAQQRGDVQRETRHWQKVSEYIRELLVDERKTLEDANKSSITFQRDFSASKPDDPQENERNSRWNKRVHMRVACRNKSYGFGLWFVALAGLCSLSPLIGFHLFETVSILKSKEQLGNVVDLYRLTAETWTKHLVLQHALLSTILWNGSLNFTSARMPSPAAFKAALNDFRRIVIHEFAGFNGKNLGQDLASFYRKLLANTSVCELASSQGSEYSQCLAGSTGEFAGPFPKYLRFVLSTSEDTFASWEHSGGDPATTLEILASDRYRSYLASNLGGGVVSDIYYSLMVPLSNALKVLTDSSVSRQSQRGEFTLDSNNSRPSDYYLLYVIPLTVLLAAALSWFVLRAMVRIYRCFWLTVLILPVDLIVTNPLLCKDLRKVEQAAKTRISFF